LWWRNIGAKLVHAFKFFKASWGREELRQGCLLTVAQPKISSNELLINIWLHNRLAVN